MEISTLKGQEHVKRALEVAAVGQHSIQVICVDTYQDGLNYVFPIAQAIGVNDPVITKPCPCGHYGSSYHLCYCTAEGIAKYRSAYYEYTDIVVEMDLPDCDILTGKRSNDTNAVVIARIKKAQELLPSVSNDLTNSAAVSLMKAAVKQLYLSQTRYDGAINVARSITALAGEKYIRPIDIAEAIQYVRKGVL